MVEPVDDVGPLRHDFVEIYRDAFCGPPYDETDEDVARFRDEKLPQHVGSHGFRCAVARDGGDVVGFSYGHSGARGREWTDAAAEALGPALAAQWLDDHFELVELAVRRELRGRGLGSALHDRVLEGVPHRRAVLATWGEEYPAWHLYRRRGWQRLAPFGDRYVLMGLQLRD